MNTEPDRPAISTRRLACLAGAVVVGAIAWLGIEFTNGANVWSPGPMLMIGPAWLIGEFVLGDIDAGPQLVPLMGAFAFTILAIPLLSTRSRAAWPASTFSGLLVAASIAFFAGSWAYGVRYQGFSYTVALLAINVCFASVSVWLGLRAARTRAYWTRYAATLVPCVWFVWFAFPWLGEMP